LKISGTKGSGNCSLFGSDGAKFYVKSDGDVVETMV